MDSPTPNQAGFTGSKALDHSPKYNVQAVAKLVGLSPVTLRAWERRYGLPSPARGEHGYRLYSDYDVRTLRWLKQQTETGLSISRAVNHLVELRAHGQDPVSVAEPAAPAAAKWLAVGDEAPDVELLDSHGRQASLSEQWTDGPILLSVLRHFGCLFCREWLSTVERRRAAIAAAGLRSVLVGVGQPTQAAQVAGQIAPNSTVLTHPDGAAHTAFGVERGALMQLAGPAVMAAAVRAARSGQLQGETTGDIALLSALFVIDGDGRVRYAYYSRHAGDLPDLNQALQALDETDAG